MRKRTVLSDEDEFEGEDGVDVRGNETVDVDESSNEDDDEEEEEEGHDEHENDGFILDDTEEEEDGEEGERDNISKARNLKTKRRKSENEKNYELDEDDYELLEENNITGFHQPSPSSKKFKRLKKAGKDDKYGGKSGFRGGFFKDITEEEQLEEEDDDTDEEDEMADFIVDEEEVDEKGGPARKKNPKKRIPKHAAGVSSRLWQDSHYTFGDVDELLGNQAKNGTYDYDGDKLEDEFESVILGEKYMIEKYGQFQEIDIPERIQLFEEITGPVPEGNGSIQMASRWIYNQLVGSATSPVFEKEKTSKVIKDIGNVLGMLHLQKLDIPFIAMYRKELIGSLLTDPEQDYSEIGDRDKVEKTRKLKRHKFLWAIWNLDKKWLLLQKRKNALQLYYNKHAAEEARRDPLKKMLLDSLLESLKDANSERDVDDIDLKFDLLFPRDVECPEEGQFKTPKRKSLYSICRKAGLGGVASKFLFSPEQFGKLLNLEKMGDRLEDAGETPEDVAAQYIGLEFVTPEDVLKGVCHMAAVDISCDLLVKKHICTSYMDRGVISTKPTLDGNAAIDSFHQFSGVKWLRDKPLSLFNDAQWLLIQKAEEEKLLQVTLRIPDNEKGESWIQEFEEKYLSDGVSKATQLWNDQRRLILKEALSNYLIPFVEKEIRSLLTARAKSWLIMEYGKKLWEKVSVAPYQWKEKDGQQGEMSGDVGPSHDATPRVMACCWGPWKPETTFVMLDSFGSLLDVLYTPFLSGRSRSVAQQQRKKNDQKHVLKFMSDYKPDVVVLGAASLACTRLKDDISEIITMIDEHSREVGQVVNGINVVYGDESLPRLYENSAIALDQLPGQQGIVRRAVALGRFLQNPLAMVAALCGPGKDIVSLKLHQLEHFLTTDERYEVIEQVMVDATNQVGIDINLAACHEWLFAPLQFVSGLGPRKASSLQQAIVNAGRVYSRKEIPMNLGVLNRNVFINAASFLRVCASGKAVSGSQIFDLLDDTRIHPESYELAHKMANDVCAKEDITEMDEDVQEVAIEHVRNNPKLRALDIEEYAKRMERLGTHKLETLHDIKMELLYGFQDWRRPYSEPEPDEIFYMISGETKETLAEGRTVQATVIRVQPPRVMCVLKSGLMGWIMKEDFSDDIDFDLCEKVSEGSILTCRIKDISMDRFLVFLTCRGSELNKTQLPNYLGEDPYYCEDENSLRSDQEKSRKELKMSFKPRMITHTRFQNLTTAEAMEFLSNKEPGESIIRPSSKGPSYLTLTLKVYDGVYAHKEIAECGKDYKDMSSLLHLGKILKIGEDVFEDLDEVMDRYVNPLVANLKNMLSYHKFKKGSTTEVDDLMKMEKSEHPNRIVYCFGVSHKHPGVFILSYIRTGNPRHEYISLYPKGFQFRKEMFGELDRLVAYFQKNINNLQHNPVPSASFGGSWNDSEANSSYGGWSSDGERSKPGSKTDRNDYRGSGERGGHPSGLPRPPGRGGRGRGMYGGRGNNRGEGHDSAFGSKWGQDSVSKDDNGKWGSFSDDKVQNSSAADAFPVGSWGGGSIRGGGEGGSRNNANGHCGGGGDGGNSGKGSSWGGGGSDDAGGGSWGGGGGDGGNIGKGSSWGGGGGDGDNSGRGSSWGGGGSSSGGGGSWGGGVGGCADAGGSGWGGDGVEGGNRSRGSSWRGGGGDGGHSGRGGSWGGGGNGGGSWGGGGSGSSGGGSWGGGGGNWGGGGGSSNGSGRCGREGGANDDTGGGSWGGGGVEGGNRGRGSRRGGGGGRGGGTGCEGYMDDSGGSLGVVGGRGRHNGGNWRGGRGGRSRWGGGSDGDGGGGSWGGGGASNAGHGGSWGDGDGGSSKIGGGSGWGGSSRKNVGGDSWGAGSSGGRSWGAGGISGDGNGGDTGRGGDSGGWNDGGGSLGGGGGDCGGDISCEGGGGGNGSKTGHGGGNSWGGGGGGNGSKTGHGGGNSWGGGGNDGSKADCGDSWGGGGGDVSKSDRGDSWGGGDGGGSSWGGGSGADGRKASDGGSWGGVDGGGNSWGGGGGADGSKASHGGSWGGVDGGGNSRGGGGGAHGSKASDGGSWGGVDGGGNSWGGGGGADGSKASHGGSWGGGGGGDGSSSGGGCGRGVGGRGNDDSWGSGSGPCSDWGVAGSASSDQDGDRSRGLLGRGPGRGRSFNSPENGNGWSRQGSDDKAGWGG